MPLSTWASDIDSVQHLSSENKKLIETYNNDYNIVKKFYSNIKMECMHNYTAFNPDGSVKNKFTQLWHVYRLGEKFLRMDSHTLEFDAPALSGKLYQTALVTPKGWYIFDSQDGKTYRLKSYGKDTAELLQGLLGQVPFLSAPYSSSAKTPVFLFGDFLEENKTAPAETFVSKVSEFEDKNGEMTVEFTSNIPILKSWVTIVKKSGIWVNKKIVSEFIAKTTNTEKPVPFEEVDLTVLFKNAKSKYISIIEYQKESKSIPLIRSMVIKSVDPQGITQWVSNYKVTNIEPGIPDSDVFDANQFQIR